ncbi:GIY-YIG nuclease family protein [Aequorivita capsosiphonis]|uniref:GIY-YIG nuclease family protein n=1 Tax=Aequorivita capsosiphonis TaxID=487317 RepID=UPI001FE05223|nr:GIY-YIG nuclease family protein [Aequorivita capsosiphonis]
MYILKCHEDTYYTGSTIDLMQRFLEHQSGHGANYTVKRLPVLLFYFEEYPRIELAFHREKQVQNWNRKKKEALVFKKYKELHQLSVCKNNSHCSNKTTGSPSGAEGDESKEIN